MTRRDRRFAMARLGRLLLAGAFGAATTSFAPGARAQSALLAGNAPTEYAVKAAFVFRMLGLIEWPASAFAGPETPLWIGVASADELADALVMLGDGRQAQGRAVKVTRLDAGAWPPTLHAVFVGGQASGLQPDLAERASGRPWLTLTESDDGLAAGGVVNFVVIDERVRFDIALETALQRGLRISSRLLGVARHVVGARQ